MINNKQLGQIGETAVMLELQKRGFDVININISYSNYPKSDLICINAKMGNASASNKANNLKTLQAIWI